MWDLCKRELGHLCMFPSSVSSLGAGWKQPEITHYFLMCAVPEWSWGSAETFLGTGCSHALLSLTASLCAFCYTSMLQARPALYWGVLSVRPWSGRGLLVPMPFPCFGALQILPWLQILSAVVLPSNSCLCSLVSQVSQTAPPPWAQEGHRGCSTVLVSRNGQGRDFHTGFCTSSRAVIALATNGMEKAHLTTAKNRN